MTEPARPNPIPDSYRRVTPCLTVRGAAKALEFYAAVFGTTERMRTPGPGGTIVHAEILIGDSVVIIADEDPAQGTKAPPPGGLPGSPTFLFIYVEDVDAVIAHAVELGASLQRPGPRGHRGRGPAPHPRRPAAAARPVPAAGRDRRLPRRGRVLR